MNNQHDGWMRGRRSRKYPSLYLIQKPNLRIQLRYSIADTNNPSLCTIRRSARTNLCIRRIRHRWRITACRKRSINRRSRQRNNHRSAARHRLRTLRIRCYGRRHKDSRSRWMRWRICWTTWSTSSTRRSSSNNSSSGRSPRSNTVSRGGSHAYQQYFDSIGCASRPCPLRNTSLDQPVESVRDHQSGENQS